MQAKAIDIKKFKKSRDREFTKKVQHLIFGGPTTPTYSNVLIVSMEKVTY